MMIVGVGGKVVLMLMDEVSSRMVGKLGLISFSVGSGGVIQGKQLTTGSREVYVTGGWIFKLGGLR